MKITKCPEYNNKCPVIQIMNSLAKSVGGPRNCKECKWGEIKMSGSLFQRLLFV